MSATILTVRGLSHRYAASFALHEVSLEINEPCVIGLIGANGAGKSTLMNIVSGCLAPTTGAVEIVGTDLMVNPISARARIGFLPQNAPVSSELSIVEYLRYCAELYGIPGRRRADAIERVLSKCNLLEMQNRLIGNLSGGFRQRVGIAQSIIHKPDLIILDEPTVGLDPDQVFGVRELIQEVSAECTIIFSSHTLSEVEVLCDRILLLQRGRLVFDGDLSQFRNLNRHHTVHITALNMPNPEEVYRRLEGVKLASQLSETSLELSPKEGIDLLAEIMKSDVIRLWEVREVYRANMSVEDVYKYVVKEQVL